MGGISKEISWADIMSILTVIAGVGYFLFFSGVDVSSVQSDIDANTSRIANIDKRIDREETDRKDGEKKLIKAIEAVERKQETVRVEQREDNKEQNRKLDAIISRLPNGH